MLTGILDIDEGAILIDGKDITKEAIEAKRRFGYVSDSPDQFLNLKGIEYLNFLADIYQVEDRRNKIEEVTKNAKPRMVVTNDFSIYEELLVASQNLDSPVEGRIIMKK